MAIITIEKRVRQGVEVKLMGEGATSVGETVDFLIGRALKEGAFVDKVSFDVDEAEWKALLKDYHGSEVVQTTQVSTREAMEAADDRSARKAR